MQIVQLKNSFVEKVLRDKEGRLARATFCVYENGGRVKARLVSVIYINELSGHTLSLSTSSPRGTLGEKFFFGKTVVSPYFSVETLYQNGSKPRAPTR